MNCQKLERLVDGAPSMSRSAPDSVFVSLRRSRSLPRPFTGKPRNSGRSGVLERRIAEKVQKPSAALEPEPRLVRLLLERLPVCACELPANPCAGGVGGGGGAGLSLPGIRVCLELKKGISVARAGDSAARSVWRGAAPEEEKEKKESWLKSNSRPPLPSTPPPPALWTRLEFHLMREGGR
ncbi:hypothetical protein AOLI_G00155210 [Acnodon oligacanthus]